MRRLQLGMWHEFDPDRWERYSLNALNGMEISQYTDTAGLEAVRSFCDRSGGGFGVHGPITANRGYKLPLLNSPEATERREAMRRIEEETVLASRYGADYILFHYPYFPVFQPPFRKPFSKFPNPSERYEYDRLPRAEFRDVSERLFHELGELQHRHGQRILLEHDFFGEYEDIFIEMFLKHPEIRLVADTARLDITKRAFHGFDPYGWIDRLAGCVYLVHYSNVRYDERTFTHHLPVREAHDGDDGYGDAFQYLAYLAERNATFHLTFEHNPDLVEPKELSAIYRRAAATCGISARPQA